MKAKVTIGGAAELMAQLDTLPEDLARVAEGLVVSAAQSAAGEIVGRYPIGPGSKKYPAGVLRAGVRVDVEGSGVAVVAMVRSTAPHAHLYEYGTQTRQTAIGAGRGNQPARATFWPVIDRYQATLERALIDLLRITGFTVSGKHAA